MLRAFDVTTSYIATIVRVGAGMSVRGAAKQPEKLLELYEFEGCPFCRRVREVLSTLDLDAMVHPCPKGGRFRADVEKLGGKQQFPFLVDPNTGTKTYESEDIARYLAEQYGRGKVPVSKTPLGIVSLGLASAVRGRGSRARASKVPEKPLTLWSFEASPFCRIVRERLCELELPYHLVNVAKGSAKRDAFVARSGKMRVPYLDDPNTGAAMFESADIAAYLEETYGAAA